MNLESGHLKDDFFIRKAQLEFYAEGKAGCAFAALAAKNPARYGWQQVVIMHPKSEVLREVTQQAISDPQVSMISLIFPDTQTVQQLLDLIEIIAACDMFFIGQDEEFDGFRCIGLRARVNKFESWISGFGPFDFLPVTRRSPYVEITFRIKPRPNYKLVMKKSPKGVVHLADLDFFGDLSWAAFQTMWRATLRRTESLLGHKPDIRSAAKTTFAVPKKSRLPI